MSKREKCAENILSDLISGIDIKPFGPIRKGNKITALATPFGSKRRIHGCTKNLMVVSYEWEAGGIMPTHEHELEQISYIVSGKVKVTIGNETFIAEKGDSYTEPKGVLHSVEALEPSVTIEAFAPPRPLFLILEAAAYHDVHGAWNDLKKGIEASKREKKKQK